MIGVRHNFETAHRLPQLGGKCGNLHGHSWRVLAEFDGPLSDTGVVADFGVLKAKLRAWIDSNLDHGAMLSRHDLLAQVLVDAGCRVFLFGLAEADGLWWPTVENTAILLGRVAGRIAGEIDPGLSAVRVTVTETGTNQACWVGP